MSDIEQHLPSLEQSQKETFFSLTDSAVCVKQVLRYTENASTTLMKSQDCIGFQKLYRICVIL